MDKNKIETIFKFLNKPENDQVSQEDYRANMGTRMQDDLWVALRVINFLTASLNQVKENHKFGLDCGEEAAAVLEYNGL